MVADRIVEALQWYPECSIDELSEICPDLSWNAIFLAVDRMSRTGQVMLQLRARGVYTIRPSQRAPDESVTQHCLQEEGRQPQPSQAA